MKYSVLSATARETAVKLDELSSSNTQTLAFNVSDINAAFYTSGGALRIVHLGTDEDFAVNLDGEQMTVSAEGYGVESSHTLSAGVHRLTMSGTRGVVLIICRGGIAK